MRPEGHITAGIRENAIPMRDSGGTGETLVWAINRYTGISRIDPNIMSEARLPILSVSNPSNGVAIIADRGSRLLKKPAFSCASTRSASEAETPPWVERTRRQEINRKEGENSGVEGEAEADHEPVRPAETEYLTEFQLVVAVFLSQFVPGLGPAFQNPIDSGRRRPRQPAPIANNSGPRQLGVPALAGRIPSWPTWANYRSTEARRAMVRLMPKAKLSSLPRNHLAKAVVTATIIDSAPNPRIALPAIMVPGSPLAAVSTAPSRQRTAKMASAFLVPIRSMMILAEEQGEDGSQAGAGIQPAELHSRETQLFDEDPFQRVDAVIDVVVAKRSPG